MSEEGKTVTEEIRMATGEEEPLVFEDSVPIPFRATRIKWGADAARMKVGQSVLFQSKKDGEYFAGLLNRLGHGYITEPEGKAGLRVWKVRKKPTRKTKSEAPEQQNPDETGGEQA